MLTLQKTFSYVGDLKKAPVTDINLEFRIPLYEYSEIKGDLEGNVIIKRTAVASEVIPITKKIESEDYLLNLPESFIIGKQDDINRYFERYLVQSLQDKNLDNFLINIDVQYFIENKIKIGEKHFEAIFFFKQNITQDKLSAGRSAKTNLTETISIGRPAITNLTETVKKNIFLINKAPYYDLLKELSYPSQNEFYLLEIIYYLVDVIDKGPFLLKEINKEMNTVIISRLSEWFKDPSKALIIIKKYLDDLFDFPLSIPEVKTIDLGGSFTVKTSDNSEIMKEDLSYYDLSVEYSISIAEKQNDFQVFHFDWNKSNKIQDNTVPFSFTDNNPIIQNGISGLVSVKVKGFDGSVLYKKEFNPEDPALNNIEIEVPLMRPIKLNPLDENAPVDKNKKLRGQILVLSKKCTIKDLTVLIQAKKEGDKIWRIVGAAKTNGSGYFSIPYPYGIYTEAQAIVSLTPNNPTDVPIIANNVNNQTISDDFLYLLVKDADCLSKEEERDCKSPKKRSRLPDYADLLDSDEYSQDIGGSCVNLSTPNRTLSEYNYTAIVRTSDPDVANYTLKKIDASSHLPTDTAASSGARYELVGGAEKRVRKPIDLNNPVAWQNAPDDKRNLSFYQAITISTGHIIDLNNPVAWQNAPDDKRNLSLYQAVTISTGHILHYKALFKADGYSLGDLLYSLPLAPGQKKEIVVLDSSHTLQGAEAQNISQGERLAAGIIDDREITNLLSGSVDESLRGSSSANTSGVSAGFGAGVIYGPVGAVLGVSGGVANSNSSASQDSSRNVSQFFGEKLRQSIMQNAEGYRQLNASVVTTVQEGQRYSATTEVVANHNHCHALTMMYFEVLRHYAIFQELSSVEECVFVPLLMTNFTTENIFKWRDVLATQLLPMPSDTYLQPFSFIGFGRKHPLLKAFDANERIKTNYANVDFPMGPYDDEQINFVKGEINLRVNLQRPKTRYDRIKSLPVISKSEILSREPNYVGTANQAVEDSVKAATVAALTGGLSLLFDPPGTSPGTGVPEVQYTTTYKQVLARAAIFDQFMKLDANYETVPPAQCIRVMNFQPISALYGGSTVSISGSNFFENGINDQKMWEAYANILGYSSVYDMLDYYFKGRLIAEWDEIFYNDIASIVFNKIVDSINIDLISTDITSTMRYKGGERLMHLNLNGTTNKKRNQFPLTLSMFSSSPNIRSLKDSVTLIIENVKIFYSTSHYNGILFSGYVGDDLLDGTVLFIPENSDEKRNPRKEDIYLVNKLIEHLNSNLEYYNKALWYNLDQDRRYMLLDGFNIQIFNDFNLPVGFRSLASVLKNELITIVGNSLVFPVAEGYKVSQSYITEETEDSNEKVTLFDHYKPLTPVEPYRISVPSKGVFVEAVQGACNACEKIESDRLQDWNRFPDIDQPTQILPINTPTPTITDWKAAFKDFATPMVNIQNAPSAPSPGAGLAGLSDLLGKSDIFKDITGLDANQQNVIKTYLSNQENAKAFAEMAKEMTMQGHNTQNSDKIMKTLNEAKNTGAINQDDYSKLVKEHLQQQIDGGESRKAELEKEKPVKSTLTDAAVKAAEQGKEVKAQKIDKEGNAEAVEIGGNSSETILAKVEGTVPKLKQENDMACWATVATMMMSWKKGKILMVPEVLTEAGDVYLQKFNNKEGLYSSEKEDFIYTLNMIGEAPANYTVQQYIDWLNTYGPLWITTDSANEKGSFSPHARILTKILGTGTPNGVGTNFIYNDPATGTEISESFTDFLSVFEQMITDNKSENLFIQIVHFKDIVNKAEGAGAASQSEEQKLAKLKADNKLDFASKKTYLEYLMNKSFSDALQAIYNLSKEVTGTSPTGYETIKDLLDRTSIKDEEKAALKVLDDKGVIRRLKVIYNEDLPIDLTDIEKADTATFFANQMEINRDDIQKNFTKTAIADHLTLKSFPKTAEAKENAKNIIHACIKFEVFNKKHIAYCLATANGESQYLPVMEYSMAHVFTYDEESAQYYYANEGKQSYNTGSVASTQTQLSDYLISELEKLKYIKVTNLALRTFTKGDNIDDVNFNKLNTLLTTSLSTKDAANKWTDKNKNKAQTLSLFTEMSGIMNAETPAKKIITDDLLKDADFYRYAGKGLIQTTGKEGYKNIVSKIKINFLGFSVDLENEPEKILLAENAIYALVIGLKEGAYGTRKKLSYYLKDGVVSTDADWEAARQCVNGTDRKEEFAQCAKIYSNLVFRLIV